MRTFICLMLALSLGACCSTDERVSARDGAMKTPRSTTSYLKWAYENDEPRHVYNCLSRRFIEVNEISFTDIQDFWPRVRAELDRYVGSVAEIEHVDDEEGPAGAHGSSRGTTPRWNSALASARPAARKRERAVGTEQSRLAAS